MSCFFHLPGSRDATSLQTGLLLALGVSPWLLPAGCLVDTSPEKAESKKSLELPRLTETSIKDRLAKYQAAVSKQGTSPGLTAMVSLSCHLCQPALCQAHAIFHPCMQQVAPFQLQSSTLVARSCS